MKMLKALLKFIKTLLGTFNKALAMSYIRHFGGIAFGIIVATSKLTNRDVFTFTKADWLIVANSFWLAVFPLLKRFFSKKFPDFGIKSGIDPRL